MKELINKIKNTMQERDYWLYATNGNNTVFYFNTPVEELPQYSCEVYIQNENDVQFKFKYITKRCIILSTDNIGSFFDDEHFKKFEGEFWRLATELYNFENK